MLPFTYRRLPVNADSTYALSVFKSHLENILCCDVQSKNKTKEKNPKTRQFHRQENRRPANGTYKCLKIHNGYFY